MKWLKHKKQIGGALSIFFVFIMTFVYHLYSLYSLYRLPMLSVHESQAIIVLEKSASASQFTQILKDKGFIYSKTLMLLWIRMQGVSNRLKAGVYQAHQNESAIQFLDRVVAGDVVSLNFTIISGTTQQKISQDLARAQYLEYNPDDWRWVTKNHLNAEGLLLADTYQYRGGSSSKTLLMQAHQELLNYLEQCWKSRSPGLPYRDPYELLIAASILEKETAVPKERQIISGVIVNRLKKGMPLQMDPTVIYGLGAQYMGKLSHHDLFIHSPYNSYQLMGLPPTPIAMVGKEAIDAAAHPDGSNYLYFVAKGDGTHQFSETYEQQKQAINRYQRKDDE